MTFKMFEQEDRLLVSGVSCVELEDGELEYGEVMVADPLDVKREDVTERIRMKESFLNNGFQVCQQWKGMNLR